MLIVLYIMSIYIWERRAYKVGKKERIFGWILVLGMTEIAFDGITAYTVNHLADVPAFLNGILHMIFLCSVDAIVFIMFLYKEELTGDFIDNLVMAAPMHDIGKIAIPDFILQKPGKLTDEEFRIMKTHAEKGGKIIQETFGQGGETEYEKMAYEVARYHHEKWNGKGYPEGKKRKEIPLCARIMAIADVFDAVSAKRCYRDALPLDQCFRIIEEGSGWDFDPLIAEVFLDMREEVEKIYEKTIQDSL